MSAWALGAVVLGGCAAEPGPFTPWLSEHPDRPIVFESPTGDDGAGVDAGESSAARSMIGRSADAAIVPADASAEDYVGLAMARNPRLIAARAEVERMRSAAEGAGWLDDPMLTFGVGDMAETAAGRMAFTTGISQKFPLPEKLSRRRELAEERAVEAEARLREARVALAAETRRAFWNLYGVQRAIETTRTGRALLADLAAAVEARVRAGTADQQDLLRTTTELARLDGDLIDLAQRRASAAAMLNTLIDRPTGSPLPDPPIVDPPPTPDEPDDGSVDSRWFAAHPELDAIRAAIERHRHELRLARLDDWPDLTIGLNYAAVDDEGLAGSANGDDQAWVQLGVNLPIWREPRLAARRQAIAGIKQQLARLNDRQLRIEYRAADALARVRSQRRLVELFDERILPDARRTVDLAVTQYGAAAGPFLDVIDHWRTLLDYELMQHRNIVQLRVAEADLTEAIGRTAIGGVEGRAPGGGDIDSNEGGRGDEGSR